MCQIDGWSSESNICFRWSQTVARSGWNSKKKLERNRCSFPIYQCYWCAARLHRLHVRTHQHTQVCLAAQLHTHKLLMRFFMHSRPVDWPLNPGLNIKPPIVFDGQYTVTPLALLETLSPPSSLISPSSPLSFHRRPAFLIREEKGTRTKNTTEFRFLRWSGKCRVGILKKQIKEWMAGRAETVG